MLEVLGSPRGRLLAVAALLAAFTLLSIGHQPTQHLITSSRAVRWASDTFSTSSMRGKRTASCRAADWADDQLSRRYGSSVIKLSRAYEGTGILTRRMLVRAKAGLPIRMAAVGGSITFGHALTRPLNGTSHMFHRVLSWLQEEFPGAKHTLDLNAALPAVSNIYLGYCMLEHIDPDELDLVFLEMDVNSLPYGVPGSLEATEAIYRTLRDLPNRPAIIGVSALALTYENLSSRWINSLLAAQWLDVPLISLRNWLVPHLASHPDQRATWYNDMNDIYDDRHINQRGHVALGDLIIIYLREQLCELERGHPIEPQDPTIPGSELNDHTLALGLLDRFSDRVEDRGPVRPLCRSVTSRRNPLMPIRTKGWTQVDRNDKLAWEADEPGSIISFEVETVLGEVGLWVWHTEDSSYGRAMCTMEVSDGTTRGPRKVQGFHTAGYQPIAMFDYGGSLANDLPSGKHTLTCRNERDDEADEHGGARYRIYATLSR